MDQKNIIRELKTVKDIQMSFVAGSVEGDILESTKAPFHLKIVIEICGGPNCHLGCEDVGQFCQEFKRFLHTRLVKGGDCRINGLLVS
jgi:hypothetical protein